MELWIGRRAGSGVDGHIDRGEHQCRGFEQKGGELGSISTAEMAAAAEPECRWSRPCLASPCLQSAGTFSSSLPFARSVSYYRGGRRGRWSMGDDGSVNGETAMRRRPTRGWRGREETRMWPCGERQIHAIDRPAERASPTSTGAAQGATNSHACGDVRDG